MRSSPSSPVASIARVAAIMAFGLSAGSLVSQEKSENKVAEFFSKGFEGFKGVFRDIISSPDQRKRLDGMKTEPAWKHIEQQLGQKRSGGGIPFLKWKNQKSQAEFERMNAEGEAERRQQLAQIQAEARQKLRSNMSLQAFNLLCDNLAAKLAVLLSASTQDRKPKEGEKFVLVVGKFTFLSSDDSFRGVARKDPKLDLALQRVIDRLSGNALIRERFTLVTYEVQDANALINKIGGGSDKWVSEDGRNYRDVVVKNYHPDDIFLLTGDLIQEFDGKYTMTYDASCRVLHPRSLGQAALDTPNFQTKFLYHPTREWLTEGEDSQIGAATTPARG